MPGKAKDTKAPRRNALRVTDALEQLESRRRKSTTGPTRKSDGLDLDSIR